ncbi:PTS transporter subunit IIABC [Clostridium beijerinckii]|jgi:PTS system IIA component, Glc family (TC 4.A.1)/PTS system IIB component, Glc family (TC 4.A.1)/PTS system IIC component, Glc family (TC 4.A.1)|uniref:PTS transporter subunit EIIC n=2 Tax=Clostridium beijerinckii TaxID=1520 RepID=A0A1S8QRQ7_CLOBE|nr:PTS transporter subunit IIABC [Clostridium beijerinckii]AMQ96024.1 PTS system glucose-specific EIICBA component [Clostridium sp. MF28]ABR32935.1 PTS system, glucose subfamily, IIA subunit [Clostridium beijerinckii NCIMB 8052]AIU04554.1 PTS system, glucose subfamily, IIA subunit [Clostridium beijerinckii ATCC 35702]MBF7807384.1 PTS transporter subunit EIIC [Clostridium beijerinckii]NRT25819.1 PTS system D-glucosamine-specific IIC component [Clostridium beijerinckii]
MKDKVFGVLQRVGRSFMLPIAILPVAGLFLGIGESFTNKTMLDTYGITGLIGPGTFVNALLSVMNDAGNIVFENLPLIFAIGVAIGMSKKEREVAALAAGIAFLIMHASIGAMIKIHGGTEALLSGASTEVLGIISLQMGVFGGIIVGLGTAALHNRYYKIELPQVLSFFGGTRFVPIICSIVYLIVGILMFYIWPPVQGAIYKVGNIVLASSYAGTWVYGLMERLLIPFGLHHVFYLPFWQTAVGGTAQVGDKVIEGAQNIFFAELGTPGITHFSVSATRFMSGKFPLMIFGLPGAALAMYKCAKPEKRKAVGGLLLSAALTSMLTGITEPIEFTFLFVAPVLYGIHCVLAGLAYMLMHMLGVGVGMTFSGGFIDLFLFGILQGNAKTSWILIVIVGIVYFVVYYLLFTFLIKKLDLKTPGREDSGEVKLYTRSDLEAKKNDQNENADELSAMICRGLGGKNNISDVDCCVTRLRCTVHNSELVNEGLLKQTGASGIFHKGVGVQIMYGPRVTVIKSNLEDYLVTAPDKEDTGYAIIKKESEKDTEKGIEKKVQGKVISTVILNSPLTGEAKDLSEVPDEVFASRIMGDGAVVVPSDGNVIAPADGVISFVFPSKHALGLTTTDGLELLIHIGIDTVKLDKKAFETYVEEGDKVQAGDKILSFDLEFIKNNAPSIASPCICTALNSNQKVRLLKTGDIKAGEALIAVDAFE